jgi:hypothetical protein
VGRLVAIYKALLSEVSLLRLRKSHEIPPTELYRIISHFIKNKCLFLLGSLRHIHALEILYNASTPVSHYANISPHRKASSERIQLLASSEFKLRKGIPQSVSCARVRIFGPLPSL